MNDKIPSTLSSHSLEMILQDLASANSEFQKAYTGPSFRRQPVHTVYGGAHLFTAQTAQKLAAGALQSLEEFAGTPAALAAALEVPHSPLWDRVHERVKSKLKREAVEDFRIDFEDGYGNRPDDEEDDHASRAATEVAAGLKANSLPPFIGLRIKPFNAELCRRSIRTLDIFLTTLLKNTGGRLPAGFVVTIPKVTVADQSRALARLLSQIEGAHKLPPRSLVFELMIETPQSIIDAEGQLTIRKFIDESDDRCVGAHFGTYDYTAGCSITAAHQTMDNPVCDFAKHVMQVALAGTPIMLSDGATNVMPVGTREVVHRAWRLSYGHIRHSLTTGYYQGWDLHPAQIPIRYAAVYSFFLEGLEPASQRLRSFVEKAAKATLLGDVFDDAATGQGLLNYFLRGLSCGAVTEAEALATGLTLGEIQGRSFLKILEGRKKL